MYTIVKIFLLDETHFIKEDYILIPQSELIAYMFFLSFLCVIIPIFTNFISFYYIVRKELQPKTNIEKSLYDSDIKNLSYQNTHKNKEIEHFLE